MAFFLEGGASFAHLKKKQLVAFVGFFLQSNAMTVDNMFEYTCNKQFLPSLWAKHHPPPLKKNN